MTFLELQFLYQITVIFLQLELVKLDLLITAVIMLRYSNILVLVIVGHNLVLQLMEIIQMTGLVFLYQ